MVELDSPCMFSFLCSRSCKVKSNGTVGLPHIWIPISVLLVCANKPHPAGAAFKNGFSSAFFATAQQSYCRDVGIWRPSFHLSVRRHGFLGNQQVDWHQILVTATYPSYLQILFFFQKILFIFLRFLFVFINIGPYGRKNFKRILIWKCEPARFTPKNDAYCWGASLPKLLKKLWNLKFWNFAK